MLATEAALRQMDPRLEDVALIFAPPSRVLARITLPLTAASIAGAALIVFVLAVSEFGVPALLRVRVYTTEVFTAFAALYDFGRATALTLPLLVLAGGTSLVASGLLGRRVIAGRRRAGGAIGVMDVSAWRLPVRLLSAATIAIALVTPVLVILSEATGTSLSEAASRFVAFDSHQSVSSRSLARRSSSRLGLASDTHAPARRLASHIWRTFCGSCCLPFRARSLVWL